MSDKPSAPERVRATYRQLSEAATDLNSASDELGKTIIELDAALKQLNLGISAWVVIASSRDNDGTYWSRSLGYTKIGSEWGIALKDLTGNEGWDEDQMEIWRFNDAPRWMRVEGVSNIAELLEQLTKRAGDTAEKIRKKTVEANELAAAIKTAATDCKAPTKLPPPPSLPSSLASKTATPGSKATMPLSALGGQVTAESVNKARK